MIAGRYSLDREIGRGGMGAVWLGRDEVLGRPVALKRIGMPVDGSSPDLRRAEREARLAARLNHPHVVAIFDLVDEDDTQWLVMEYVEGSTLAELVRNRGPLTPAQAAPLLAQAADALAAAHAAGIVHRDVKPSNILVGPDGRVKLSDFGIAKAEADASLTQTGLVTGSPAYLAPEVASGRMASGESDVWSLGATLFHALTGRPPYDVGDNVLGAMYRIVHEDPPRLDDAGWLAPLLESSMTHDPADRWSMAQVRDFLGAGPSAPLPRPRRTDARGASDTPGTQVVAPAPPVPARGRTGGRRRSLLPVYVGVAVLALLAVAALAIALGTDDDPGTSADPTPTRSTSQSPSATPSPTDRGIREFVETYLETAADDPARGFMMLTPGFKEESNGIEGYTGFWGRVEQVEDVTVTATDVDALTVAYTYTYELEDDSERTEDVRLRLEYDQGRYLIAGEA